MISLRKQTLNSERYDSHEFIDSNFTINQLQLFAERLGYAVCLDVIYKDMKLRKCNKVTLQTKSLSRIRLTVKHFHCLRFSLF